MLLILIITIPVIVLLLVWAYLRGNYQKTKTNETIDSKVILNIAVPKHNDKSPLAAEQLFSSLHGIGLNREKAGDHFSMEIAAGAYGIFFLCVINRQYKTFFENQIYAQYPEAQISEVKDYTDALTKTPGHIEIAELVQTKDYYLPIRTFTSFDVDPLSGLTGAISKLPPGQEVFIQIVARPIGDSWQKAGKTFVDSQKANKEGEPSASSEQLKLIETKNTKVGFQFSLRVLTKAPDQMSAQRLVNEVTAAFSQYRTAILNSFGSPKKKKGWAKTRADFDQSIFSFIYGTRKGDRLNGFQKYSSRYLDEFAKGVINTEEFASLYHLPNKTVETPNISWARSKKLEYPLNVPTKGSRILGLTDYRGVHIPFGIMEEDRLRHMYVIGKSGTGKSTFMESMIMADIYEGKGVGVIDPHGELVEHILDMMPPHRLKDIILFDPGDIEYPVGLNLLEFKPGDDKSLIADGIVSVFKKFFENSWGPRLEYILTNTLITLLSCQNISLLAIPRMLSDDNYRKFLLKQIKDPILLKFWNEEYAALAKDVKRRDAEISSILNKIGRFTTNPLMRNIVGQISSSFDLKQCMDEGKIVLINLSQGKIGEENMALLGGMIITRLYSSAVRRQDPTQRRPFFLYVDEFQNFTNLTFIKILSEARKYGLSLTIAHQFIDQIDPAIANGIFGNVGSIINFTVGAKDAAFLIKEYTPYLEPEDLVNLPKHSVIVKELIDASQSKPFTAKTLAPQFPHLHLKPQVLELSRKNNALPREVINDKIFKWAAQVYNAEGNLMTKEEVDEMQKRQAEKEAKKSNWTPRDPNSGPGSYHQSSGNSYQGNSGPRQGGGGNYSRPSGPRPPRDGNYSQQQFAPRPQQQAPAPRPAENHTQSADPRPQPRESQPTDNRPTGENASGERQDGPPKRHRRRGGRGGGGGNMGNNSNSGGDPLPQAAARVSEPARPSNDPLPPAAS